MQDATRRCYAIGGARGYNTAVRGKMGSERGVVQSSYTQKREHATTHNSLRRQAQAPCADYTAVHLHLIKATECS